MRTNNNTQQKSALHPRNRHRFGYNFDELIRVVPELANFVQTNQYDKNRRETIDFSNAVAVKLLNMALLKCYYGIEYWDIPDNYLCPPIPGRVDYLHYLADLIKDLSNTEATKNILDIGTGANLIYPLLGQSEYGWKFVASECDLESIKNAQTILTRNNFLNDKIELRHQKNTAKVFDGIISSQEKFDACLCNPPFHKSQQDAAAGTTRKWKNLGVEEKNKESLNFGGACHELWCHGGELEFISKMVLESKSYQHQIIWFTSLVSKKENIKPLESLLKRMSVKKVITVDMSQGQKRSRFIAWSFK